MKISLNKIEVLRDSTPFFNYGFIRFLEDFDYFFEDDIVKGINAPVSQDKTIVGPLLMNYKVDGVSLGMLDPGSYTVELQVGDAGWNKMFEIYTLQQP